jgi:hypothetical protein
MRPRQALTGLFPSPWTSVLVPAADSVTAINARASSTNGSRLVDVFGGSAFHPAIGHDVFMLLHETGHHLTGRFLSR